MIPKISAPLAKAIRTSEGIAVWAINLGLLIGQAIPSTGLSTKEAAILATINTGLHVGSRTLLKVTAVAKNVGLAPLQFSPLGSGLASAVLPTAVAGVISSIAQDTHGSTPPVATVEAQVDDALNAVEETLNAVEEITAPPADSNEPAPAPVDAAPPAV